MEDPFPEFITKSLLDPLLKEILLGMVRRISILEAEQRKHMEYINRLLTLIRDRPEAP